MKFQRGTSWREALRRGVVCFAVLITGQCVPSVSELLTGI